MYDMQTQDVVRYAELESSLQRLETGRAGGVEGLFGPDSISWRIICLGGPDTGTPSRLEKSTTFHAA